MATKSYKRMALELAEELGAEVCINKESKSFLDVTLDAPEGYIFVASGCTSIVQSSWDGERPSEVWKRIYQDLSEGLDRETGEQAVERLLQSDDGWEVEEQDKLPTDGGDRPCYYLVRPLPDGRKLYLSDILGDVYEPAEGTDRWLWWVGDADGHVVYQPFYARDHISLYDCLGEIAEYIGRVYKGGE